MKANQFQLQGLNLYNNPIDTEGYFLRAVNVDNYPYGAIKKRPGYAEFLGTQNGGTVQKLFQWTNDDASQSYLYSQAGSVLMYYDVTAGTGDWATCGNGTFAGNVPIGHTVVENTLIVGDGVGSTRHTTNGTSFTDTSGAPLARHWETYQGRAYAGGTANTLFASATFDATNWSGAGGTNDAFSIDIMGEGRITKVTKISDRLVIHKGGGNLFRWDGDSLVDMATNYALTSPESYAEVEDYGIWLNRMGLYGSGGSKPELISNAIQPLIYNDNDNGIAGTTFDIAPATAFKQNYFISVGNIADDLTEETITNAIIKYDYQKNQYYTYSFADKPTAMGVYKDSSGVEHLIFGDNTGQVYKFGGTATTDAGQPIYAVGEVLFSGSDPANEKSWRKYRALFNPGSQAKIQIALSDTFRRDSLRLTDLGDTSQGNVDYRFPQSSNSKLLFIRVYENSKDSRFNWFGHAIEFEIEER